MKTFMLLGLMVSALAFPQINENDLLWRLDHLTDASCEKQPLSGTEPVAKGLLFTDFRMTSGFLRTLGEYTYAFDKQYLASLADALDKSTEKDLLSIFFMNALEPYFRGFGYVEIKRRYVDVALENLTCLNQQFGIKDLASLSNIQVFQEAAVKLLIQSFSSARTLTSESNRVRLEKLVGVLGDALAKGISTATLDQIKQQSVELESVNRELVGNPFLRSRSASDLLVIKYLVGK